MSTTAIQHEETEALRRTSSSADTRPKYAHGTMNTMWRAAGIQSWNNYLDSFFIF
jgi:hypothetical protein